MKRILLPLLVSALLSCQPEPTRVLVLYENAGHHKPFSEAVLPWLREIAPQENLVLTEVHNPKNFNEEYLAGFDVIVQLDYAPYGWPEEAVEAFEEYVDEGRGGWVGFHHASLLGEFDGFPMWDWFSGLLGGIRYENYIEPLTDGTVCVEDASHPVMAGVPATFVIQHDEFYTYQNDKVGAMFHGTGDLFSSTVIGEIMRGKDWKDAMRIAADYTAHTIQVTLDDPKKPWYGVDFEATIPQLINME